MRLIAGLLTPEQGSLTVLGVDAAVDPQQIQDRIGYMPQRFGLYDDLTVQENLDLYADLHDVPAGVRRTKYPQLMEMTALGPFKTRLAGQLSGGMKQKLGLACTLVSTPELLLLDEPTAGVDPLSRRELWQIIRGLVRDDGLPVVVSTSYLDEADRCDHVVVLHRGRVLDQGPPSSISSKAAGRVFMLQPPAGERPRDLQARVITMAAVVDAVPEGGQVRVVLDSDDAAASLPEKGTPVASDFEDGFMTLLRRAGTSETPAASAAAPRRVAETVGPKSDEVVVRVQGLVRKFGAFTAIDNINFEVRSGEIFGLLGPNGAGKTTTFRMLCGLLAVTGGELSVGGADMRRARASARGGLGYVAQKFSLYGLLSVAENLDFFASVYGLRGAHKRDRIDWALAEFELGPYAHIPAAQLAGGFQAAAGDGRGAAARAADPLPGRADKRRRSVGAAGLLAPDHRPRQPGRDRHHHHPFHGRGGILRPHRHSRQRPDPRPGDAGRDQVPRHRRERRNPTIEDAFIAIVEAARAADAAPAGAAA